MQKVTAAILIKDGKILIAQREADDRLAYKWEFPGGKIREGESPQQCLAREMQEEFDIVVSVGAPFGETIYHYPHGKIQLMAYYTYWKGGSLALNAHADYRWIPLQKLGEFDFSPADVYFVEKLQNIAEDQLSANESFQITVP
jgi:8-oxo-dGTP diphosphatase